VGGEMIDDLAFAEKPSWFAFDCSRDSSDDTAK
jgi:hypothetical protein